MAKKLISTLLISLLSLSVVTGCGTKTESQPTSSEQTKKDQVTTQSTNDGSKSEKESKKEEAPVTIRIFSAYDSITETQISKFSVSEMEKELNIKLERDEVPGSAYQEKLQLALAAGNYPDAFIFNSHTDALLLSGVDNGLFIPLNEYINNAPNLQQYIYPEAFEAAKIKNDDNIYLVPRSTMARNDGFIVRKDWLDKIGFEVSSPDYSVTKDQFVDIMKKFTLEDPDGNGKNDTYGYIYQPSSDGNIAPVALGAFDCLGWQESTGEYKYMDAMYEIGNKNFKEALEFSKELFAAGYTHPDGPVTKDPLPMLYNGSVGSLPIFAGHVANREMKAQEINPDAKMTYISGVTNDEGKLQGSTSMPGIWGGVAITKDSQNPQKVVDMMNYFLSDQAWEYTVYGEPGYSYTKENNKIEVIAEPYKKEKLSGWNSGVARRNNDPNFFLDLSLPQDQLDEARNWIQVAMDTVVFSQNLSKIPDISTDAAFIEAENKRKEAVTKIIMGVMPVEEYDKVLESWYAKGGKTYVEQINQIIEQIKNK